MKLIKKYNCIKDDVDKINIKTLGEISICCQGKLKTGL